MISESYTQIRTSYDDGLEAVNGIAGNLHDTCGIKTVISENGEIVYFSGYSFVTQGQRPGMFPFFLNAEFKADPSVSLIEGKGAAGVSIVCSLRAALSITARKSGCL